MSDNQRRVLCRLILTVLHKLRLTDPEQGVLLDTAQVRIQFGKYVDVEIPYEVNHVNNRGLARMLKTMHQNTVRRGVDRPWRIRFAKPLEFETDPIASKPTLSKPNQYSTKTRTVWASDLVRYGESSVAMLVGS